MSLSLEPLRSVRVEDPTTDLEQRLKYGVFNGGNEVSYKPITSTSFSTSSAQFTAPPPSPAIIVDRHILLRQPVKLTFVGTAPAGQNLLQSGYDAFRANPLSSVMQTLTVSINNTSVSINQSDVADTLARFHNDSHERELMSTTPDTPDASQQYSDLTNSVKNPLAYVGDSSGFAPGRGGFGYTAFTNSNTLAVVEADLTEALKISPLLWGSESDRGLVGVQNMDVQISWDSDLKRMWSHASGSGSVITSITVEFLAPQLLFRYITPNLVEKIPESITYPYMNVDRYPTDGNAALAAGASTQVSSANIQLQSIPKRMYLFARRSNATRTYNDTDSYLAIKSLNLNWNNRSGLLSSATQQDLYKMSKRNGLDMSWSEFSGQKSVFASGLTMQQIAGPGSICCLEFGKDIGLNAIEAPGLSGTYQCQINAVVENVSAAAMSYTFYIIVESEGSFVISNNRSVSQIGVISKQDVLDAKASDQYVNEASAEAVGGKFNFGSFLRDEVLPVAKEVLPLVKDVATIAAAFKGGEVMRDPQGRADRGAGVAVGGKKMTRAEMRKRLLA